MTKPRILWITLSVVLFLAAAGFVLWAETPLGPMPEAMLALQPDSDIAVRFNTGYEFRPSGFSPVTGLILYPGGRVDPRAYAPAARQIARQGYLVVIVPMALNLAVFSPNRAGRVIRAHPEVEAWAVGGHSLGGAMAASFASKNIDLLSGLVLWASYPPASSDLSGSGLQVLSVYGNQDKVLSRQQLDQTRSLLPVDTRWVEIQGGNHAQFGWYGLQPGDGTAGITREEQQDQIVSATLELLDTISKEKAR